ncbi:MAG: HAMP domain-containing histidine kinase [Acidobacteriota bacterium]|nr:HAMP domain-containing histidine kinase [Acidobacteriota bacterium]
MKKTFLCAALLLFGSIGIARSGVLGSPLSTNYLPHRYCYLLQPRLVWTNVSMDALIAISYITIFVCLFWMAGKLRRMADLRSYVWIAVAFGTFIVSCAATHVMEIVTIWWPVYPMSAAVKVLCAIASVASAILFARATPVLAEDMGRSMGMLTNTREEKDRALAALIASEKLAAAGRISASISHEIRNPLDSVGNLLFLLVEDARLPSDLADLARSAASEVSRANGIAHNSLALYQGSSGPSRLSLHRLVMNVLELQEPVLMKHGIVVETRMRGEDDLLGYSSELRQILINLLSNAEEATGSGGRILVRVQPRTFWPQHSEGVEETSEIVRRGYSITIADTGSGIDAAFRPSLFGLFSTTKGDQGTGIGLWLVRSLIEKHGGSIRFRSRTAAECARTGTIFNLWLPLAPDGLAKSLNLRSPSELEFDTYAGR